MIRDAKEGVSVEKYNALYEQIDTLSTSRITELEAEVAGLRKDKETLLEDSKNSARENDVSEDKCRSIDGIIAWYRSRPDGSAVLGRGKWWLDGDALFDEAEGFVLASHQLARAQLRAAREASDS